MTHEIMREYYSVTRIFTETKRTMKLTLTYRQTDTIDEALRTLDARRYAIEALVPPGFEAVFQRRAQYVSTQSSTAIEGNQLSLEAATPLMSGEAAAVTRDEIEVRQLNEAYDHAYRWTSDESARIDEGVIRALNSVLLKDLETPEAQSRGAYRRRLVGVRRGATVVYVGPPPEQVPGLMEQYVTDLRGWIEKEPGPVAAALAHFGLVSIHPFDDGNGRVARLVADMVLDLTGWSVRRSVSVSASILAEHQAYYAALQKAQGSQFTQEVDATPFIEFHMQRLRAAFDGLQVEAATWMRLVDVGIARLGEDREAGRLALGLLYLLAVGPISSSEYARLCSCSQATAGTDLKLLVDTGVAERVGGGRSTRYRYVGPADGEAR